jgi:hypothetical protein
MAGGDEGVAAVVARPGEDQQRRPLQAAQRGGQVGGSQPGALHQWLVGGDSFDGAQVGGAIKCF